jgi:hypothetical protein
MRSGQVRQADSRGMDMTTAVEQGGQKAMVPTYLPFRPEMSKDHSFPARAYRRRGDKYKGWHNEQMQYNRLNRNQTLPRGNCSLKMRRTRIARMLNPRIWRSKEKLTGPEREATAAGGCTAPEEARRGSMR